MLKIDFSLPPEQALKQLKAKGVKVTFDYRDMLDSSHEQAFTITKMMQEDLLKDVKESITQSMKEGTGFNEWKKNIKPTLQNYGWLGEVEVINPKTGEIATINVDAQRLQTIFQTNIRTAQARAHYDGIMDDTEAEYWRVVTFGDQDVREAHARLFAQFVNAVRHKSDPWWNENYPRRAGKGWWGCRCEVECYTLAEVQRHGWTILTPIKGTRKNPFK